MGLSKLWYLSASMVVPVKYIKMFNKKLFTYFWSRKWEPVRRNTLISKRLQGGFSVIDIQSKICALRLQHLQKLISGHDAKWTFFAIYWTGMSLRRHNPAFASVKIPHSVDFVPPFYKQCLDVYHSFISHHPDFVFSTVPTKIFYNHVLDSVVKEPRVFALHPHINFARVLSNVHDPFVDVSYRDVSWRIVHGVLPVHAYLNRLNICRTRVCPFVDCKEVETVTHLLFDCRYVKPVYVILLPWLETLSSFVIPHARGRIPVSLFMYPDPICIPDKYRRAVIMYLISLCKYVAWTVRNRVVFDRKAVNRHYILITFLSILKFRILADFQRFSSYLFNQYWVECGLFCHLESNKVVIDFM
jgi:hypothetical protein